MRSYSRTHRALAGAASVMLIALLAGCAGGVATYQPRPAGVLGIGYTDSRIDASHYAVIYTDTDKDRAQNYLPLRAAQVAQTAGFAWFAFDTQGVAIQRKTETQFDLNQLSAPGKGTSSAVPLNNYVPPSNNTTATIYYSAAGRVALLTPEQAKANPKAIEVASVLAKMGSTAKP